MPTMRTHKMIRKERVSWRGGVEDRFNPIDPKASSGNLESYDKT